MKGKQNIIKGVAICFVYRGYCYFFQGSPTGRKFIFNSLDQEVSEFMRILAIREPPVSAFIEKQKTGHLAPGLLSRAFGGGGRE